MEWALKQILHHWGGNWIRYKKAERELNKDQLIGSSDKKDVVTQPRCKATKSGITECKIYCSPSLQMR